MPGIELAVESKWALRWRCASFATPPPAAPQDEEDR